jgi:signal recognition particle subunit SRP54
MTGQDAIKSAGEFNRRIGVTGVVLSKMDGDARGGAALSVVGVVGVPIAFVGSGERLQDLEPFHADRVVSRVLGMGDVLSLIEKAEEAVSVEDAAKLERRSGATSSRWRTFAISCGRSARWARSSRSSGCCPGMARSRS